MRDTTKLGFAIVAVFVIAIIWLTIGNELRVTEIPDCKVIELQQQQLVKGSGQNISTEIRYLVITDKETFVCETSLVNGKFNNSDVFFHLKKDSTYNFRVAGVGKGLLFDYKNILEVY